LTLTVTLAVLASALLHASWNALVKTGADRLMMMGWIAAATGLVALPFLPFTPLPGWDVAKILCLSFALHVGYKLFLVKGYEHGDFGQVYPLSRGLAPAIVTVVGAVWLKEILPTAAFVGVGLIALGIVSLAFRRTNGAGLPNDPEGRPRSPRRRRRLRRRGRRYPAEGVISGRPVRDALRQPKQEVSSRRKPGSMGGTSNTGICRQVHGPRLPPG
jgi:multidrug transporter EmrE-like cation transporter